MWDSLIGIDTDIFLWFNSFHAPFWDYFMKVATGKLIWGALYVSILIALWKRFGFLGMGVILIFVSMTVLVSDQVTASFLRPWIGRLRPSHPESPIADLVTLVNDYRAGRYGFPSSHASNTFSVVLFLSLLIRKVRFIIMMGCWALLNCYSRLYLGVHYPGDLMVGGLIGVLVGLCFYYLLLFLTQRWQLLEQFNRPIPSLPLYGSKLYFKIYPSDLPVLVFLITVSGIALSYLTTL